MLRRSNLTFLLFSLACVTFRGWAQDKAVKLPRFEDYPVHEIFGGAQAAPHIPKWIAQQDADAIKGILEHGWGWAHGRAAKGPNFAGRFILMTWSCGAPCIEMAIVDAGSGAVYIPPITDEGLGVRSFFLPPFTYPGPVSRNPEIQFRLNSSLFIVSCNDPPGFRPYTYYFLWRNTQWTLLRKAPLK